MIDLDLFSLTWQVWSRCMARKKNSHFSTWFHLKTSTFNNWCYFHAHFWISLIIQLKVVNFQVFALRKKIPNPSFNSFFRFLNCWPFFSLAWCGSQHFILPFFSCSEALIIAGLWCLWWQKWRLSIQGSYWHRGRSSEVRDQSFSLLLSFLLCSPTFSHV